jgi:hypothetical protein
MNITKDEARLLAAAIEYSKFDLNDALEWNSKEEAQSGIELFNNLEAKLEKIGDDKRRYGRKSRNSFKDLVKRLIKKSQT